MRYLLFLLFLLPSVSKSFDLQARFDYALFYAPNTGHYIETYVSIVGHSVKYLPNKNNQLQAKVEIIELIKQDDKIVTYGKYEVDGPEIPDSVAQDIKNLQRFSLDPGVYELEIIISDLNDPEGEQISFSKQFKVFDMSSGLNISGVELLETISKTDSKNHLTKSGYDLVPLIDNFYPPEINKLAFYCEIYNSDKVIGHDDRFIFKTEIMNYETMDVMSGFSTIQKYDTESVQPVIKLLDIESLPSGSYNLVIKIINRSNEVVVKRDVYFERLNPIVSVNTEHLASIDIEGTFLNLIESEDTIDQYIRSLRPITTDLEKRILDKNMESYDFETKKQFFYSFWKTRNPENPEDGWNRYRVRLKEVDFLYTSQLRPGYETDRGIIYLKYGKPDYVESRPNDPSSYPYEMWQYYKIDRFNNRRFIFYLPSSITNDYVLLHSDMQGEVQNYRWQTELQKRNTPFQSIDATRGIDHFGDRSMDVFERTK